MSGITVSSGFIAEGAVVRVNTDWTGEDTTEGKTSSDLSDVDDSEVEGGSGGVGEGERATSLEAELEGWLSERLQAAKREWRRRDWRTAAKQIKIVNQKLSRTYQGQPCFSSEPSGQSSLASQSDVLRMHLLSSSHGQR